MRKDAPAAQQVSKTRHATDASFGLHQHPTAKTVDQVLTLPSFLLVVCPQL